jgi:tetratricopeptide (TPR) repeat protein
MKQLTQLNFFFILTILAFVSFNLYPQKSHTGEKVQIQRDNHERGNDRKGDNETGERKEHKGIKIERPTRTPPKIDPGRNDPKEEINTIDNNIILAPFIIPIAHDYQEPPQRNHPEPEPIYDPIVSGLAKLEELDYFGALKDFNNVIEADTSNYKLYYYRGLSYLNLKNYIESIKDFDVYLNYFFYDMEGYFQRGLAKFYLKEKLIAFEDFSIAADMGHKIASSILRRFY